MWTSVHSQTPATQPSTAISTEASELDSIPSSQPAEAGMQKDSLTPTTQPTDSIQLRPDSLGLDSLIRDSTQLGRRPRSKRKKTVSKEILSNDVYYFYSQNANEIFEFIDTTLNSNFFQYDPARTQQFDYASLGNIGTPLQSLQYRWEDRSGTRFGLEEVFKPYLKDENDLRFFTKSKAFTDVTYSQGLEQNDHIFNGTFGRSFDNGIKFSLEHNRLVHSLNNADVTLNTNAFYPTHPTKNTNLLTGLAFQKEGSKYHSFLTYAHNEINQLYTGGLLTNDSSFTTAVIDSLIRVADDFDVGVSLPNNITNETANLRYRLRTLAYDQYLTLIGKTDSLSGSSRIFNVNHKIKYVDDVYRFSDTRVNSDYYQDLVTDDRGLRVALNQKVVENYFGLNTLKTKNGEVIPSILGDISLGLRHQLVNIDGEIYRKRFNNIFAEGSWKVSPFKALTIDVFGQLGLLDNIGDFRLNAEAILSLNKWGILEGRLRQQLYNPSVYEQQNFVTQFEVWNTDFNKSFNSELGFTYKLPQFDFEAGASFFLLDNHIYFSDDFVPVQRSGAINIVQLYAQKTFNWKILHLDNTVVLQNSTDSDVIRFPNWWSKHSFYIQGRIFRRIMLARFGFDLRLNPTYFANNFNPALGHFYVQSEREVELYPAVDAHFGFVVDKFRIYLRMENLTSLITDDVYSQIPYYPQKELAFRFGISWRFLDRNSNQRGDSSNSSGSGQRSSGAQRTGVPGL